MDFRGSSHAFRCCFIGCCIRDNWKIQWYIIVICLLCQGAAAVHFQDFNAEVIRCLTIPNVNANLSEKEPSIANVTGSSGEVRFYAGDWSEIHELLPHVKGNKKDQSHSSGHSQVAGYDIILMAETVYSISTLQSLYELMKKVSLLGL